MRFCKFDLKKKFDDDLQKIATLLLSTESNEEAVVNYAQQTLISGVNFY